MVQIYYQLIVTGKKTINQVPDRVKEEVRELLKANGYAELANPVV